MNPVLLERNVRTAGGLAASYDIRQQEPSPGPGLGNNAKSLSPPPNIGNEAVATRFALQNAARCLMPMERVAGCCRWRQAGRETVDVWHLPEHGRARFGGLQTCGSVWMCPVCSTRISEARKAELTGALNAAHEKGWTVALVTYTVRHDATDGLPALLAGIAGARQYACGGKVMHGLRRRAGWVGSVRALEVTHGEHGWHPHIHELVFLRSAECLDELTAELRRRWEVGLAHVGMRDVNEYGFDVQIADADVAGYVAKFGRDRAWNVEHELSKQTTKRGRNLSSRSPMQMLAAYAFEDDTAAGWRWMQYAQAMKGKRQLSWSKGLKAELGIVAAEKSDQELAEDAGALGVVLASLSAWQWAVILARDARAQVVNVAGAGDAVTLLSFVAGLEEGLTPRQLQRIHVSTARAQRSFADAGRALEEVEARELGLSYYELRAWRRGGVEAIAVPGAADVGEAQAGGARRQQRRCRRGVKMCELVDGLPQVAMFR